MSVGQSGKIPWWGTAWRGLRLTYKRGCAPASMKQANKLAIRAVAARRRLRAKPPPRVARELGAERQLSNSAVRAEREKPDGY